MIIYKILKKGYPLEVIKTFENWKKVIDVNRITGWISDSQLSNKGYFIVNVSQGFIFKFPNISSKKIAVVKRNFILEKKKCKKNWCFIKDDNIEGWMRKKTLWGG